MIGEIIHVYFDGPIVSDTHDFIDVIDVFGLPIGSHTHHLVFATIDAKAQICGEGRVE